MSFSPHPELPLAAQLCSGPSEGVTCCEVWDDACCGNFQLVLTYGVTAVAEVLLLLLLPVAWGLWSL